MGADEYFDCIASVRLDLLELFGSGYVIEHCVSVLNIKQKNDLWKDYIATGLQLLVSNLASAFGGKTLSLSYRELVSQEKEEEITEEEIIENIQRKLKG